MTDNEVLFVRSSKKSGNKSGEDFTSSEDDVWDDTLLIKAYDKAVQLAQQSYLKKNQSSDCGVNSKVKKELKWKVGDKCRCQYSEDFKYYEADVIEILNSTGLCVVKYVGYGNEEKVPLKKLKQSKGEFARIKQCEEASNENEDQNEVEDDSTTGAGSKSKAFLKKSSGAKKGQFNSRNNLNQNSFNSLNFPFPGIGISMIPPPPPPPPPHMFNKLSEDESETEAMSAMLMSWYMSGYHTGFYQGLKMAKKQ